MHDRSLALALAQSGPRGGLATRRIQAQTVATAVERTAHAVAGVTRANLQNKTRCRRRASSTQCGGERAAWKASQCATRSTWSSVREDEDEEEDEEDGQLVDGRAARSLAGGSWSAMLSASVSFPTVQNLNEQKGLWLC